MSMRCRVCKEEEEETVSLLHGLNKLFRCNDHCIFFGRKMVIIRQVRVYIGEGAPFLHLLWFRLGFYHQWISDRETAVLSGHLKRPPSSSAMRGLGGFCHQFSSFPRRWLKSPYAVQTTSVTHQTWLTLMPSRPRASEQSVSDVAVDTRRLQNKSRFSISCSKAEWRDVWTPTTISPRAPIVLVADAANGRVCSSRKGFLACKQIPDDTVFAHFD